MQYELAKKLKEAGFPQGHNGADIVTTDDGEMIGTNEISKMPHLEELIEACGEDFESLIKQSDNWVATQFQAMGGRTIKMGKGETPIEAVANLWLELHS